MLAPETHRRSASSSTRSRSLASEEHPLAHPLLPRGHKTLAPGTAGHPPLGPSISGGRVPRRVHENAPRASRGASTRRASASLHAESEWKPRLGGHRAPTASLEAPQPQRWKWARGERRHPARQSALVSTAVRLGVGDWGDLEPLVPPSLGQKSLGQADAGTRQPLTVPVAAPRDRARGQKVDASGLPLGPVRRQTNPSPKHVPEGSTYSRTRLAFCAPGIAKAGREVPAARRRSFRGLQFVHSAVDSCRESYPRPGC